jgi:hypothetical protein
MYICFVCCYCWHDRSVLQSCLIWWVQYPVQFGQRTSESMNYVCMYVRGSCKPVVRASASYLLFTESHVQVLTKWRKWGGALSCMNPKYCHWWKGTCSWSTGKFTHAKNIETVSLRPRAVSSIYAAQFSNKCSTQADNSSQKLWLPISLVCPRP